jgi:hypothetical protein
MPIITATIATVAALLPAIGPLAITGAAAGFATGTWAIASTVVYAGLSLGLSYAQQALARTQTDQSSGAYSDSPASINAPAARGNVKQAIPSQSIVFGETRFGGKMFFYEVKPPYLYVGFLYSSLPISQFLRLYVGEREVTFSALPDNTIVSPVAVDGQPNYPGRLSVCVQRGRLDQGVNAIIAADFPDLGPYFMTPGVACAVFKCHYGSNYDEFVSLWGNTQIPNFQWVARGAPLPDPRKPGHRLDFDASDPEDLYNAIATWDYSDNASLAEGLWAALPFGLGATPQRINWPSAGESADFDDEAVDGQRRPVVAGMVSLSDKPNVVMEAMFTANRGFASQRRGQFHVSSSQPRDPVMTITDSMLIGGFKFRNNKPKRELVNIGRCQFMEPTRNYQDADGVIRRDDQVATDGEEFEQTVRLAMTPTFQRAERVLKGFMAEARLGKYLTVRCPMVCYGLREGMVVRRFSETGRYSVQDHAYSIEDWELAPDRSSISFALAEYDPAIARPETLPGDAMTFELDLAA